ncbi:hypothetical protein OG809_22675 [Kribbella soli]
MSRTRTARSIAALAAASIGITVVPIGMQTAQAAATPEGFIVDFQNSAHRLVHVSPGLIDVSPSFMDAQSSPSVVALADGNYEESFQAADHTLWIANSAAGGQQFRQNCSPNPVPEMPGTGTGITVDAHGQVRVKLPQQQRRVVDHPSRADLEPVRRPAQRRCRQAGTALVPVDDREVSLESEKTLVDAYVAASGPNTSGWSPPTSPVPWFVLPRQMTGPTSRARTVSGQVALRLVRGRG